MFPVTNTILFTDLVAVAMVSYAHLHPETQQRFSSSINKFQVKHFKISLNFHEYREHSIIYNCITSRYWSSKLKHISVAFKN